VYYLHLNGQQAGPFALDYLRDGWRNRTFTPETLFWQEGMAGWQPMESIRGLLEKSTAISGAAQPMIVAGFWRRLVAFLLDVIILGTCGYASGLLLFDFYASLDTFGPLVGLVVATVYFGLLNSSIGGGQTPGKRALRIRVVDSAGAQISPGRSFARILLLWAPWTLNSVITLGWAQDLQLASWLSMPANAWYAALIYLFVFNRRTRQATHDLLLGTYVARDVSLEPAVPPSLWRGHLIVAAVIVVLLVALDGAGTLLNRVPMFARMFAVRDSIVATGQYRNVMVTEGTNYFYSSSGTSKTKVFGIVARLKARPISAQAAAAQVALLALKSDPGIAQDDRLDVSVAYGYDIGIASGSISSGDRYAPAEWPAQAAKLGVH
jgi:uncharacterized RDD family membrane protein YckC